MNLAGQRYLIRIMQIYMAKKLKRDIEDDARRQKRYGAEMSSKIKLRMAALSAAESLGDFWPPYFGPERCHELKGDLAGTFSMDLKHPYRLLFIPADLTETEFEDEKQRWQTIKSIEITSIEDTHG
jgi:proteic killer suppression protein